MLHRFALASLVGLVSLMAAGTARSQSADIVVYGGTSGGVAAAVQAARTGRSAILIHPGKHLGGMTSGGLGATDTGNRKAIGGIAVEFYGRVKQYYRSDAAWVQETRNEFINGDNRWVWHPDWQKLLEEPQWYYFEPHVAERIFDDMARETGVKVFKGERLDLRRGVEKRGTRIVSITMESGKRFAAKVFIDATYEGDLMAKAGVEYHVGREPGSAYNERFGGVRPIYTRGGHQFSFPIDPYVVPGQPASGLLPTIEPSLGRDGEGNRRVQAYNYRLVLTDVPSNRVPFPKPDSYDPRRYELFLRYLQAGLQAGNPIEVIGADGRQKMMPNRKSDTNNHGAFSTDDVGMNYDYPDGDYATRERIVKEHVDYTKGLFWFVLHDPRVPEHAKRELARYGFAKDEFTDNGNFPHELYVREARRMIGPYVMTEHDCTGARMTPDSAGLASYGIDSHITQRYVDKHGHVRNEGTLGGFVPNPYPVSYRALTPKAGQCTNLLVPVCLSATHAAYGSIRMEPVFMILGQSAATAATLAIEDNVPVQEVRYDKLRKRLLADRQILEWTGPVRKFPGVPRKQLSGIVLDEDQAELLGFWIFAGGGGSFVGIGYVEDDNANQGEKTARFRPVLPAAGEYEVRVSYACGEDRATNVAVTVVHAGGTAVKTIDQRAPAPQDGVFISLGTYRFGKGRSGSVCISNQGANGRVTADAVQFLPVR